MTSTNLTETGALPYSTPVETCLGLLNGSHLGLRLVLSQESIPPGFTFEIGRVETIARVEHHYTPGEGGPYVTVTDASGGTVTGRQGVSCRLERCEADR